LRFSLRPASILGLRASPSVIEAVVLQHMEFEPDKSLDLFFSKIFK